MNLEAALGRPVARVERRPSPYRTSHHLEEVDVELADGERLELVLKDLRRERLTDVARRAKPGFLHDPRREVEAYLLLEPHDLGTPRLYAHGADWVLLERVAAAELYQHDLAAWCDAARWLARLHATFAGLAPSSPRLLVHDESWFRRWAGRARDRASGEILPILDRYDAVIELLCSLPRTLVHGEFYASNVLVADARVAPVDWELAAIGPGLTDLAALSSGSWDESARATIVAAYGDVDETALAACRLHVALQWLGWASDWAPPPEHAHDWLGEARSAAATLSV